VIVDGNTNVVFLHEFLDPRQVFRRGVTGDHDPDSGTFAVLKLAAHIGIFVLRKADGTGGMQVDSSSRVVSKRLCFFSRVHRQMVLHILSIQRVHLELLHELDQLRAVETPKGIAGDAWTDRYCHFFQCRVGQSRQANRRSRQCPRAEDVSTAQ